MSAGAPSLINSPPLLLVKVGVACPCPLALAPRPTHPHVLASPGQLTLLSPVRREGGNAFSSAAGSRRKRVRRRQREDRNVPRVRGSLLVARARQAG